MFEQKKTKQDEQFLVYLYSQSPEVGKTSTVFIIHSIIFSISGSIKLPCKELTYSFTQLKNTEEKPWKSLHVVTQLNNYRKFGNAVPEISIFLLKINDLHAFVLAEGKAVYALKKNMLSPSKMLMR